MTKKHPEKLTPQPLVLLLSRHPSSDAQHSHYTRTWTWISIPLRFEKHSIHLLRVTKSVGQIISIVSVKVQAFTKLSLVENT